ncbi:MAG: hypothetical protein ABI823_20645 [Bryobacteraceae bacterium]
MRSVGRDIPLEDAKRIGDILSKLSKSRIRDAFRAAGYTSEEVESFSRVVESQLRDLQAL